MARQMVRPLRMAVKTRHRNSVGVVDGLVDYYKKNIRTVGGKKIQFVKCSKEAESPVTANIVLVAKIFTCISFDHNVAVNHLYNDNWAI